jgi:hypothetical protein
MPLRIFSSPRTGRTRLRTCLLAAVTAIGLAAPAVSQAGQGDPTNPFVGHQQFIDCEYGHTSTASKYSPWYHLYRSKGHSRTLLTKIAQVPAVRWFTAGPTDAVRPMERQAERYLANVDHPQYGGGNCSHKLHYSSKQWVSGPVSQAARDPYTGEYPVMAFRALNDKRCGVDADPRGKYRARIDAFARQLGLTYESTEGYKYWNAGPPPFAHWRPASRRSAAVILEPDALGLMSARSNHCVRGHQKAQALALLRYGVKRLSGIPGVAVYVDAGAGDWLHVDEVVALLRQAGVAGARGFALNASHFDRTKPEVAFGDKVARRLGKHYVLNTAENAHGPLPRSQWNGLAAGNATSCNPQNAGLGTQPTSHTASPYADAYLWISRPGLSSNAGDRCHRGPSTNTWFQGQALLLARRASFRRPAWPARIF